MPFVNIKYQLTLDATVHIASNHFYIQGIPLTPTNTTGGDNLPEDIVYVSDTVTIDMRLSGGPGKWMIAVFVQKLDPITKMPDGGWVPLVNNGTSWFHDQITHHDSLLADYKIKW